VNTKYVFIFNVENRRVAFLTYLNIAF